MKHSSVITFVLCLSVSNGYVMGSETPSKQAETIEISESCHRTWQQISKDATMLKYYFEGVFNYAGEKAGPETMPSHILFHYRDKSDINQKTNLDYMPATAYLHTFITDEMYEKLDAAFAEKYSETQNIAATWNWFNDHFQEKVLREPIGNYCTNMIERDAARIALEKQGITFLDQGRTMVMDASRMSEKPEDMEIVRDALGRLSNK